MNVDKIIENMNKGIVLLEYTSLISGNKKHREMTLNEKYIPETQRVFSPGFSFKNKISDKLICFDIEFGKWDDIDKDTILSHKMLTKEEK
jgi:hypothetical protein|tara:strand:+ start:299 stop:568 length:270 start_codon:yes stop_codon:yes gene_type:complete